MVDFTLPREYIDDMVVRMAHHSTAIEGNTLTQGETKSILLDNMIPRKMDLREFYEVSNYRDYLVFLMESYQEVITIDIIKETQRLLLAQRYPKMMKIGYVPLWNNICNLNVFILLLMVMAVREELLLYTLVYNRN